MSCAQVIHSQLQTALWECCPREIVERCCGSSLFEEVVQFLVEDADACARKDPAADGDALKVIRSYTSFRALLHYRLAHAMESRQLPCADHADELPIYAALISSRGKVLSGAELHARCRIGRRFVLDHGMGTVFGETAVIGDDCYVLGGVTLGARGISHNPAHKRHPTIGHRVQIGAFSRVFGPVTVGDDVIIGPHCTITEDVPADSRVTLRTSLQIVRRRPDCAQPPLPSLA